MSHEAENPNLPAEEGKAQSDLLFVANFLRTRDERLLASLNTQTTEYLRVEIARLKEWMTGEIERRVRDEVIQRIDISIADHMLEEHPLGELHQLVDSAVIIRFEHYASIFERFHVAERAITHLVGTGEIDTAYVAPTGGPDQHAIDQTVMYKVLPIVSEQLVAMEHRLRREWGAATQATHDLDAIDAEIVATETGEEGQASA